MTNCPTELTRKRRKAVLKILEDRMAVVFAGEGGAVSATSDEALGDNVSFAKLSNISTSAGAIAARRCCEEEGSMRGVDDT